MSVVQSPASNAIYTPDYFEHLVKNGTVTIMGFGSLVNEASASESFELTNFRLGTVRGFQRIFNLADWYSIATGDARVATAEVAVVAFASTGHPGSQSRVALMDVPYPEGVAGFLERESGVYKIVQVPYIDDNLEGGIALACGEVGDAEMRTLWGDDIWDEPPQISGRISYVGAATPSAPMPLVPPVGDIPGNPAVWLEMTPGYWDTPDYLRPVDLPPGPLVYPSPGYLRFVYHAHVKAGLTEELLDNTLLADRQTVLRQYLQANPLLESWVSAPEEEGELNVTQDPTGEEGADEEEDRDASEEDAA